MSAVVTQADREAAAAFVAHRGVLAARIRIGGVSDSLPVVQAFARHRTEATEELVAALEQMVAEKVDYMLINKLGDPEKQHTIKVARAALAKHRAAA